MGKKTFLAIALLCLATTALAQKSKHPKPAPQGTPVLWREPADIESRDLVNGPGGESMKPDLDTLRAQRRQRQPGTSVHTQRPRRDSWENRCCHIAQLQPSRGCC